MKAHGILMGLGAFLRQGLSSQQSNSDSEAWRSGQNEVSCKSSADAPTSPGVLIRDASDAAKGRRSQPAMVSLGPVLALLLMLRKRRPRRHRSRWHELSLPPGCVQAVRCASR